MNGAAYIMVVLGILLAKGLGFYRELVFASVFGATTVTDVYFQVFGLVNLIFTGIGVALSTLVIKNLNKPLYALLEKKREYVSSFITKTTLWVLLASAFMYVFSGSIVNILLPGISGNDYAVAVDIMHIMLPSFLFVIIAYIISGVLQNCGVFFITSIMSLPFNCIIIASLLFENVNIMMVSVVTTIGWLLHIVIQLPSFYKKGYRLFSLPRRSEPKAGLNPEIVFIFISNMMFQLCFMLDKAAVSADSGIASTITYASNLFVTISSVFVVAMSNVVFPSISKNYEEGNIDYVRSLVQYIITVMFAIFIPFILTVCCFGKNIIGLLYERGEFTADLTATTAVFFAVYTLGAFGYICQELFNKILYLDSKYVYTVSGTAAVVALKMILNKIFMNSGNAFLISASTTVLFTAYAIMIAVAMSKTIGRYIDAALMKKVAKIVAGGVGAIIVFSLFKSFAPKLFEGKALFLVPLGLCGAVYIGILVLNNTVKDILNGRNTK
ncbi:MAG: lipid II flippase MurJ [Clostridia bacterium]|nr:lipid II flippase MurJ [Clostridia bacterium]